MIKALLVILAIAAGGGAAAGVYYALPRGEEEVMVQTVATPTPAAPAIALPTAGPGWRCVREEFPDGRESFHAEGASEEAMKIIRSCTYVYDTPCYFYFDGRVERPLPGQAEYCGTARLFEVTPAPTPDWGPLAPNPKAVLSSPPQHRVGEATALGRSDCPQGWQALVSDTTGMSFCFPPEGKPVGPNPESGGYGWAVKPEHGDETWDEAVWVVLPSGFLLVHRIGTQGRLFDLASFPKASAQVSGFPAERYHLTGPGGTPWEETVQEEFLFLIPRPGAVWEVRAQVRREPIGPPPSSAEVASAEQLLQRIVDTIRLP